ncbi:FAD-binding domain-containing protein [Dothidotthia symphoricarpi CBS 119687]|uniref:FAD-binding domain-containing protein n=1 Tax=Dothidotthia symphoricarpi CBS 119687 TaxID=1392245 RepID=A0A6A5ZWM5_9PLEO|nr:FAD-binding domain-containing protein [Dothidotthia symphoricarpi CBS 119687]KAF2123435.1 FAD-binding domain-containing protein [Dothidotthia symphoricarpi CBS 119687]
MYLPNLRQLPVWLLTLSIGTYAYQNDTISSNCQDACRQLQGKFGAASVHYYAQDNFTIWDGKQQEVQYACRFQPANTAEVASGLRILTDTWCNFAVKCGGHSRHADFSNSVGGVTIDLRRMNSVQLAADQTRARVGGGAVTAEIFAALEPRNVSFVGGRVGSVGLGGFATGGGTSPLTPRWGWALDNVFEYELVLPNATIVVVNDQQNPDLYWALRGAGGGNFGIVTSFEVRTFPQGPIYAAARTWNATYVEKAVDEIYNLYTAHDANADISMEYFYGYVQSTDSYVLTSTLRHFDPVTRPRVFDAINSVPAVTASDQNVTLGTLAGPGTIPASPPPSRHLFQATSNHPSREWVQESLRIFREQTEPFKTIEGLNPRLITYPISSAAIRAMSDRGGNALGLNDIKGPLFMTLLSTAYTSPADDARVGEFYDKVFEGLENAAKRLDVYHPYKYIGYGRLGEDIFARYGADNHAKLVQIQKSVDSQGVFTAGGLCHGGFKVR